MCNIINDLLNEWMNEWMKGKVIIYIDAIDFYVSFECTL